MAWLASVRPALELAALLLLVLQQPQPHARMTAWGIYRCCACSPLVHACAPHSHVAMARCLHPQMHCMPLAACHMPRSTQPSH